MSSHGYRRHFVKGETIFRQGETGHVMYFILDGQVKITQIVRDQEKDLAIVGKGSFFGELAIFTHRSRSATARAHTDCELVEVDSAQLDGFLDENHEVTKAMVRSLARRLRETDDLLENMRLEDADSRVCNSLLHAAEEQGGRYTSYDIRTDVDQLVVKTTLDRDQVRRILIKLKRLGLVEVHDKVIHIPSIDLLRGYKDFLGVRLGPAEVSNEK